jgi:putative sterol carrier protein
MPVFNTADEVYEFIGGLFRRAAQHPEVAPKLAAVGATLQLHYSDPDAQITVKMAQPIEVITGETTEDADVHLYMRSDDADKFWRGKYNIPMGMAKGQVQATGPVNKILKLVPATKPMFPIYEELTADRTSTV